MKKFLGQAGAVILVVFILVVLFIGIGPRFGWEAIPVLSGSMEPALKVGGEIITKPAKLEEIKVGDIITFQTGEKEVTHRVVGIYPDEKGQIWFQTKGDANEEPDPNLVSSEKDVVRKVVFHIPYFGYAHGYASNLLTTALPVNLLGRPLQVRFVIYVVVSLIAIWLVISWVRKKWKEW